MRLVCVHGINNEGNSSAAIARDWVTIIERAAGQTNLFSQVQVEAPFYGDELAGFTRSAKQTLTDAVAQSAGVVPDQDAAFAEEIVNEFAAALEIDAADIQQASEETAIAKGPGGVVTLPTLRLLEKYWPGAGDFALQFVKQANAYFNHPGAKTTIDGLVAPALTQPGPQIVIGHSLGSVVTFDILRNHAADTRLYLTLGSPLPLATVRNKLGRPLKVPSGVARWLNAIDPTDFVGLGKGLEPPAFAGGIENVTDVRNGWSAHGIKGYLSDARVVRAILDALV
jgi:hypothetical protein